MAKAKSKKEIDKDIMYSKIMPTGLRKSPSEEAAEKDEPESPRPAEPEKAARSPSPDPPASARAEDHPSFFNRTGVKLKEQNPTVVANLMEYLVADKIDAAFSKFNCCKCDKCRKDVAAIALNMLKPKYVVSERDQMVDMVSRQTSAEVYTAIVKAILQVRSHPRH